MNNAIRQRIRLELSKRNMSQSQLAAEIGVSRQYLSNVMRGVSGNTPNVWEKIFAELGLGLTVQSKETPLDTFNQGSDPAEG